MMEEILTLKSATVKVSYTVGVSKVGNFITVKIGGLNIGNLKIEQFYFFYVHSYFYEIF